MGNVQRFESRAWRQVGADCGCDVIDRNEVESPVDVRCVTKPYAATHHPRNKILSVGMAALRVTGDQRRTENRGGEAPHGGLPH